eukprot:4440854-Pleurochrysis_carterae.AAC.1
MSRALPRHNLSAPACALISVFAHRHRTAAVGLRPERLIKDWRFFENAIEKLAEVRQMMMEMQAAAKRKEVRRLRPGNALLTKG